MTVETLLFTRGILNIILFLIVLIGAGGCFATSHHDGLYRALGVTALTAAAYIGVVIFISFVDVTLLPEVRRAMLLTWNVVTVLLLVAILWLGYETITERNE